MITEIRKGTGFKMSEEDILFQKRLEELANKSYTNSQYIFTGFLSLAEQDFYHRIERDISYVPATFYGGTTDCERVMLRFGSEEMCGYAEEFPIKCIEILPVIEKFAETLGHRDYLGALMNLGIERSTLGDIIIIEKKAYLFCTEKMAAYILENLDQIRHTHVKCSIAKEIPPTTITKLEHKTCIVSSERADGIIAKIYNMSRSQAVELFRQKKIFVNERLNENNSSNLKKGDRVSVRGYGKFIYQGMDYETKKGKLSVAVDVKR